MVGNELNVNGCQACAVVITILNLCNISNSSVIQRFGRVLLFSKEKGAIGPLFFAKK